jgi:hypothetical protein
MKRFAGQFGKLAFPMCALLILWSGTIVAQVIQLAEPPQLQEASRLSPPELDSLVAPLALYPDPLLSQVLVASTYPLEIVQAAQWLQQNPGLTGAALENAARQLDWDPSVQALIVFPDVMQLLSGNIQWATGLGNAFLVQQADVMDAVQRMRVQAQSTGILNSSSQMTVSTQPVTGSSPVVVIQPANPEVMYVPFYDPVVIWGRPLYPYPVLWYPPVFVGRRVLSFGPGVVIAASSGGWGGWGAWGWGPNWIGRTVIVNNNFFYRYGFRRPAVTIAGIAPGVWVHDPLHRWGVPYPYRQTAIQYGPTPRLAYGGPSMPLPNSRVPTAPGPPVARIAPGAIVRSVPQPMPAPSRVVTQRPAAGNSYASQPTYPNPIGKLRRPGP